MQGAYETAISAISNEVRLSHPGHGCRRNRQRRPEVRYASVLSPPETRLPSNMSDGPDAASYSREDGRSMGRSGKVWDKVFWVCKCSAHPRACGDLVQQGAEWAA